MTEQVTLEFLQKNPATDKEIQDLIDTTVIQLKKMFNKDFMNAGGISTIIIQTMLITGKFKKYKGNTKKKIVIQSIKTLASEYIEDENDLMLTLLLIDQIAPDLIDNYYWVSNQKFKLNPKTSCCFFKATRIQK